MAETPTPPSHSLKNCNFNSFGSNSLVKLPESFLELEPKQKMNTVNNFCLEEAKPKKKKNLLKERIRLKKLKEMRKKQPKHVIKICDFGLSRSSGIPVETLTNEVVTLWYRSPELLLGSSKYNGSCDIWSIGCIFAELITNRPLFMGKNVEHQLDLIFGVLGSPEENNCSFQQFSNYKPNRWQNLSKRNLRNLLNYSDSKGIVLCFLKKKNNKKDSSFLRSC